MQAKIFQGQKSFQKKAHFDFHDPECRSKNSQKRTPLSKPAQGLCNITFVILTCFHLTIFFENWMVNAQQLYLISKEVCNGGVACSLLKLGSLEKTVIASITPHLHSSSPFLSKKPHYMTFCLHR